MGFSSAGNLRTRQVNCQDENLYHCPQQAIEVGQVMNILERTRLEKAAADCGYDRTPESAGQDLVFHSTQFPESVSVTVLEGDRFKLKPSDPALIRSLQNDGGSVLSVEGYKDLYFALEQIATSGRTMPNRVAEKFKRLSSGMPLTTEAERFVVQRVGQNLFRDALLDYWRGHCCVTGLAVPELLRASHIKPWATCDSDEERLDVFNGLLLAPHLDALFDGGWLTVEPSGAVRISGRLASNAFEALGIRTEMTVKGLAPPHEPYLAYHRSIVFRR
jgi:putative restriction endonuclease